MRKSVSCEQRGNAVLNTVNECGVFSEEFIMRIYHFLCVSLVNFNSDFDATYSITIKHQKLPLEARHGRLNKTEYPP